METSTIISIVMLGVLILLSAFFSATETAFSSLNRVRIKNAAAENKRAALVLRLTDDYDMLLSTILIGNNIVNIASASLATVIFCDAFGDAGVSISTAVMTVLVLIFGEISPKSLAKEAPEAFAMFAAAPIRGLMFVLKPFNLLFMKWKKLISKLFKITTGNEGITEDELITIVDEASEGGFIDKNDGELIKSAIEFNELSAGEILTPRIKMSAVEETDTHEEIAELFEKTGYSRLPVYRDSVDKIIGILHIKDFYQNKGKPITEILNPAFFTVSSVKISTLLQQFKARKTHIAVVTDEYGGTLGIITLEDIIEELVGEIWDEYDEELTHMHQIDENTYIIDGGADIDSLFELLNISPDTDALTVSGFIVEHLARIPKSGESFEYCDRKIEITGADNKKVVKIKLRL